MEKNIENETGATTYRVLSGYNHRLPRMENHMEKHMEHDMDAIIYRSPKGIMQGDDQMQKMEHEMEPVSFAYPHPCFRIRTLTVC